MGDIRRQLKQRCYRHGQQKAQPRRVYTGPPQAAP
jgi:hypothetical protein